MIIKISTDALRVLAFAVLCASVACGRGESAAKRLENGDRLLNEGKTREALIEYRTAVQADARNGVARQKLGRAYAKAGDAEHAVPELIRAADLLPEDMAAQLEAARALLGTGRFEDARTVAEKIISKEPQNVSAHIVRANASAGMRDVDTALSTIEEAIKLDPTRTISFLNLGALQARQGEKAEAEAAFKQAINVDPTFVPGYLSFANYYWQVGRRDAAEQVLRNAVDKNPMSVPANLALATLLTTIGKGADAEAPLKRAAEGSNGPDTQLALADYYVGQKRDAEARPILEGLLAKKETQAAAGARLAAIERAAGNPAGAYKRLQGIIDQQPNNAQLLAVRSGWLLADGKVGDALTGAEAATKADPKHSEAQYRLGMSYVNLGDMPKAVTAFEGYLAIDPSGPHAEEVKQFISAMKK